MQQMMLLLSIGLLLGICGPANPAPENQTAPQPPPVVTPEPLPPNVTQENLQVWNDINKSSVEQACIAEAKVKAESLAWAVQGCTCGETQGPGLKVYDCGISTVQGTIAAHITCVLASSTCSLVSTYGNGSMTFDQIRQHQAQQ